MSSYAIHNTVRSRHSRTDRARAPEHARLVQRVGERRVLRARPLYVTEEDFDRNIEEIQRKSALGHIEVRTIDGRRVDVETREAEQGVAPTALPSPPVDSIAHDDPWGERVPTHAGDDDRGSADGVVPALLRAAAVAADDLDVEPSEAARSRAKTRGKR